MTIDQLALTGISRCTRYPDGRLKDCVLDQLNLVDTRYGAMAPRYSEPDERSKDLHSISFYPDGTVRSISLDNQVRLDTPIGPFPAELVAFYPDGTLEGVFPLNGRISFAWTEADEERLAAAHRFDFGFGSITARVVGVRFYPTAELKSVLLWPGETVRLNTPAGIFPARAGIRLHPDGSLASFEPAVPITLRTPVGLVRAYDVDALTVQGDQNSVRFDPDGRLVQFSTSGDVIIAGPGKRRTRISSLTRLALATDVPAKLPLVIKLGLDTVTVDNGEQSEEFSLSGHRFLVLPDIDTEAFCETSCDSCALGCP